MFTILSPQSKAFRGLGFRVKVSVSETRSSTFRDTLLLKAIATQMSECAPAFSLVCTQIHRDTYRVNVYICRERDGEREREINRRREAHREPPTVEAQKLETQ